MPTDTKKKTEEHTEAPSTKDDYTPPKGAHSTHELNAGKLHMQYEAESDWILLRKNEKPRAEMFYTRYFRSEDSSKKTPAADRPITFVFNGGPGASSVYLHLGAMGPRIAQFGPQGEALPPPHKLIDNPSCWLDFTDLVFIDPIGTGFSRMINEDKKIDEKKEKEGEEKKEIEYWKLKRDLESIGEFCRTFLSKHHRWESPIYVAGESYGGFRAAKLTRILQKDYGVPLAGAIIISPALEFTLLDGSDYDILKWLDTFPTMAATAAWHKKSTKMKQGEDHHTYALRAAQFALSELTPVLAGGDLLGATKKQRVLNAAADLLALPREIVRAKNGRIGIDWFVKNFLRDKGLFLGLYDTTVTVKDPYPDRDQWEGPDPTLHIAERVFASGINTQLRKHIGLDNTRDYALLNMEVNQNWENDARPHALKSQVGATDDLRYGMSLNPHMKVFLTHGYFDLVTPFFTANRLSRLMKLDADREKMLTVKHYDGGHMFYTWDASRKAFYQDMKNFYA